MDVDIELPDLGEGNGDRGVIAEWHFEEGEWVEEGEVLLDVLAEMDTIPIPCPYTGRLIERVVEEDDTVRTGEVLGILEVDDDYDFSDEDSDDEDDYGED
jgi:pyruvate/2-oxoglutarate dehydrogenase complex dihydrolipoamide acyltransferase (E2) component